MRVPTVILRHRETGQVLKVNLSDYILGSLPGISLGSTTWERVGETHGDEGEEHLAMQAAYEQRHLVESQRKRGEELDRMNKVFRHGT